MPKKKKNAGFFKRMVNPLTHRKELDDAIDSFNDAKENMDRLLGDIQEYAFILYRERKKSVKCLQEFRSVVSKIDNCPITVKKSCDRAIESASLIAEAWELEDNGNSGGQEIIESSSKAASVVGVAGALAGSLTATLGPSSLMALATTFGAASTGTAISALSGVAASNAALAWLGGGAIAAGGAGVAGGSFILSLLGPIGIGIAGVTTLGAVFLSRAKNDKNCKEILSKVLEIKKANSSLRKAKKSLKEVLEKTRSVNGSLDFYELSQGDKDYYSTSFPKDRLFELASLAKLLGKMSAEEIALNYE